MNRLTAPVEKLGQEVKGYVDTRVDDLKLQAAKGLSQGIGALAGLVLILLVVSLVVLLLAKLITKVIEMALLGWLNKALGFISAILVTAVVLGVLIILFDTVNVQFGLVKSDILETSVVYNLLKDFGYFIFPFLKQLVTSDPTPVNV